MAACTFSFAAPSIKGPIVLAGSSGGPTVNPFTASHNRARKRS
jgi:hypothetical protein